MKAQSIQQFAIVQSDSAPAFEGELNARIRELSDRNPKVKFDGLTAYISYRVTSEFQAALKADGTEDTRLKYGECQFAEMRRTRRDAPACDLLYKMIKDGRIGLCYRR